MDVLEFRLLGPFEVSIGGEVLTAGGGRRRGLLAALLLSANQTVGVPRLVGALWGDDPPRSAANLVQGYVSGWRSVLDPGRAPRASGQRLESAGHGYRLTVAAEECDLLRFEALVRTGRRAASTGDLLSARRLLRQALSERRGPILSDFVDLLQAEASALEERWLDASEQAADVELRLGRPAEALTLLQEPAGREPLRESITALRMLALHRAGRPADAVALFDATRRMLAHELGVDPGSALRKLHVEILRQDPALDGPEPAATSRSLAVPISSFLGREREVDEIARLIRSHRLVTLTGPGGSGKTRLAVEVATTVAADQERDVAYVDLAPVRDPDLIWTAVAAAIGQQLAANLEGPRALALQLAGRPTLLVLDNLEQIADAAPGVALALSLAPQLSLLTTSREPVGVAGEQLYPVPPLPLPAADVDDATKLLAADAVRLFVERAREADPTFEIRPSDASIAADICRRLDGLPLAIELAAPWTRTLSLPALLERLGTPSGLLDSRGQAADQPSRHRTLRSAMDWSYSGLTEPQKQLLERLSVFAVSAGLDAVEAVADTSRDATTTLAGLVDRNLVQRKSSPRGPRYGMLETIRSFARARHASRGADQVATRLRHAEHFCDLAQRTARIARSPAGEDLVRQLYEDQDEIRAAADHLESNAPAERVLTLVTDCLPLWWELGHVGEGYRRISRALDSCGSSVAPELLAAAHCAAASLSEACGAPEDSLRHARAATEQAARAGSLPLRALSQCLEGNNLSWADWAGPATVGTRTLESARVQASRIHDGSVRWDWISRGAITTSAALSLVDVLRHRDPERAARVLASVWDDSALPVDSHLASFLHRARGFLLGDSGHWAQAEGELAESLALATSLGTRRTLSRSQEETAVLAWARGDLDRAARYAESATRLSRDSGHALNWVRCAALLADVLMETCDLGAARRLLTEADAVVATGYPDFGRRTLAPRRARLERLDDAPGQAALQLARSPAFDDAGGLPPHRVIQLVELAHAAAGRNHTEDAAALIDRLTSEVQRIGLVLAEPETRQVTALRTQTARPATSIGSEPGRP